MYVLRGRRAVVDGCVDSTGEGRPCMHTNDEGGREGRIAGEQLRKAQRRRLSSPPAHAGRAQERCKVLLCGARASYGDAGTRARRARGRWQRASERGRLF